MEIPIHQTKWYQNVWAALIFFTRLPFWRIYEPPKESFTAVVEFWPLVGWLTGGLMAAVIYFGSWVMPYVLAVAIAMLLRVLLTGALHEDGLADFIDGFGGGGNDRQHVLDIMKDSHIGTYGVLGLIFYEAVLFVCLCLLPPAVAALTIFAADPFSKMLAGQIVQMMPYARNEAEAKNQTVYRRINVRAGILLAFQGLLPVIPFYYFVGSGLPNIHWVLFVPCLTLYFLYLIIWRTLRGYTGDCCGALFLLVELSVYITVVIIRN